MILGANGEAAKPEAEPKQEQPPAEEGKPAPAQEEELLSKPFLGIQNGVLTLHIPLSKTDHITARGLIDCARDEAVAWYMRVQRARAEELAKVRALAQKTGFQRFKDQAASLMRRK